jgi:hypothetical protein
MASWEEMVTKAGSICKTGREVATCFPLLRIRKTVETPKLSHPIKISHFK